MAKKTKKPVLFIEVTEIDSSNLEALHYDVKRQTLQATFKHGGTYEYHEISKKELDTILEADSIGKEFNLICVKGNKEFVKLS